MSECTMFVLDAPRVQTPEGAARQVDRFLGQDTVAAPTPRLLAFFDELLAVFPDDHSGAVWHEGFEHNRPRGSTLALVFELARFDETRLQRLRELAGRHQLHVFDPEAGVLYLRDGREATRLDQPPPWPEPGGPTCRSGLRFDGVYEARSDLGWDYVCFLNDGRVLSQLVGGRLGAKRALELLYACDAFVAKGSYEPGPAGFTGKLTTSYGSIKLEGRLSDDGSLRVSAQRKGREAINRVYAFVPLPADAAAARPAV